MPTGLYVHFPFCRNRCAYCDFYKIDYDPDAEAAFWKALEQESLLVARKLHSKTGISTIFIGGGTPSLVSPDRFGSWLRLARGAFEIDPKAEFSVECNPESVTLELLESFGELGVNRPVFGIQSFDTEALTALGRCHNREDSQRAIYWANALGFDNYGVDLLYGLPGQTTKMLSRDLDQLLDLEPPHISFYQLTVEDGTPLSRMVSDNELRMPDDELTAAMYRGGAARILDAGYERYEVCSFARPGHECRHNLGYWEGDDYMGLGPSAHSFVGGIRSSNPPNLREYIAELEAGRLPSREEESGSKERIAETIMLGLRTAKGIDRERFRGTIGLSFTECVDTDQYARLVESGHIIPEGGFVRLSDEGLCLADEIARRLLP